MLFLPSLKLSPSELVEVFRFFRNPLYSLWVPVAFYSLSTDVSTRFNKEVLESLSFNQWRDLLPVLWFHPKKAEWVSILTNKIMQIQSVKTNEEGAEVCGLVDDAWMVISKFVGSRDLVALSRVNRRLHRVVAPEIQYLPFIQDTSVDGEKEDNPCILTTATLCLSLNQLNRFREQIGLEVPDALFNDFQLACRDKSKAPVSFSYQALNAYFEADDANLAWLMLCIRAAMENPHVFAEVSEYLLTSTKEFDLSPKHISNLYDLFSTLLIDHKFALSEGMIATLSSLIDTLSLKDEVDKRPIRGLLSRLAIKFPDQSEKLTSWIEKLKA